MKKLFFLSLVLFITTGLLAQKGKEKKETKVKTETAKTKTETKTTKPKPQVQSPGTPQADKSKKAHEDVIWGGTRDTDGGGPKPSKNQPAKVRASFARDYPNATNVSWSKYRGDWTATFTSGFGRATAVYHANGERRDTRTVITREQLPNRTIFDQIFKREPTTQPEIVKVENPKTVYEVFRMKRIAESGKDTVCVL